MLGKTNHIHFVGIGGIGMSGMAELLNKLGFIISGSDMASSERTDQLAELGIKVSVGHAGNNINGSDVVVYSSAVKTDNPEIVQAIKKHVPVIRRAEMLAELLKLKKTSIAIAGTHGKTSTSSILGTILSEADTNPTMVIGGIVNKFQSNAISGSGDVIVVEADEFDRSFLTLQPTMVLITNLDLEHLDCYKNMDDLQDAFVQFANATPFYGRVALCTDDDKVNALIPRIKRPVVTFGTNKSAEIRAVNLSYDTNSSEFDLEVLGESQGRLRVHVPGEHNIKNALGAVTIALELDLPFEKIKEGLNRYTGVRRRFEIKYETTDNIMIVDDYAHHPSEVEATIKAAKAGWDRRLITVFQPHLFSRTRDFHQEFARAFQRSDILIITDIFPAREEPINGVSSRLITDEAGRLGHSNVIFMPDKDEVPEKLKELAKSGDMIMTMGAGNIWRLGERIFETLN